MPTEIAYFTPKTKTGSAVWIDFYNADMYDSSSELNRCYAADQIQFRTPPETAIFGWTIKGWGYVDAFFNVKNQGYYLLVSKLSVPTYPPAAWINIYVDGRIVGFHAVGGIDQKIPAIVMLTPGMHIFRIHQRPTIDLISPGAPFWFHSITVFEI
jgi:hypothetical protein